MCGPRGLQGEKDHLFHNNGDGTFTDLGESRRGRSECVLWAGFGLRRCEQRWQSRSRVADDSTPNYLYINKGDGTFEDDSYASGYALNQDGRETASMGIAVGDFQNNGFVDLPTLRFPTTTRCSIATMATPTSPTSATRWASRRSPYPFLGWGDGFLDYDNDGWKDLFFVNGHVYPEVDKNDWGTSFAERPLLFRNLKGRI